METSVDYERLELVYDTLLQLFEEQQHPYESFILPQDHNLVEKSFPFGTTMHAFWLFCLCFYMRGGIPSVEAAIKLGKLRRRRKNLFIAEKAAKADITSIEYSLKGVELHYMKKRLPPNWVESADKMARLWDGDPRNMLEGVTDYEVAYSRICNQGKGVGFWGFQEKMASMLLYLLMDEGLIEPFLFPPPVDFHLLRVAILTEIVVCSEHPVRKNVLSEGLLAELRQALFKYAEQNHVSPIAMANVTWLLSQKLCSKAPGNKVIQEKYEARKTVLRTPPPLWTPREVKAHVKSCHICPLNDLCQYNLGSAHYYRRGHVTPIRLRAKPSKRAIKEVVDMIWIRQARELVSV